MVLGPISRILFLRLSPDSVVISLGTALRRTSPPPRVRRSARSTEDAAYPRLLDGPPSRLFCLAPEGVCPAAGVAAGAVGSYPTFSPLPCEVPLSRHQAGRYILCDTVRHRALKRGARAWREPCTASCPMVSGLSSPNSVGRGITRALGSKNSERRPGPKTKPAA